MPKQARTKSGIYCETCAEKGIYKGFSRKNNLKRHMDLEHPTKGKKATSFQCAWRIKQNGEYVPCGYKKAQKINLVEHIESAQ